MDVNGSARFQDIISGGINSWIFHSPDDGRTTLHIAPKNDALDWDWGKQFIINGANGNVSVSGKLEAKEIKVTTTPTADFVFEDSYQLPDLASVEKHIKEKKHLPEITSAAEMQKEGVNIGDFQIKLLQKIEELTLYSIEQNKRIQQLENEIKTLKNNTMKTLKYLITLSVLISTLGFIKAQNYNPIINYSFNDTPVHGVKIITNIPFINQQGMPTIIIEGYNYFDGKPIGLIFNWYIYENEFINNSISSFGAYTPEVKLSNENGKVVILSMTKIF